MGGGGGCGGFGVGAFGIDDVAVAFAAVILFCCDFFYASAASPPL
jgi:hypothetical protein